MVTCSFKAAAPQVLTYQLLLTNTFRTSYYIRPDETRHWWWIDELQLQSETLTPGTDQTTRAEHSSSCFTSEWSARPSPERCSLRSGRRRRSGCESSRRWTLQNPWTWNKPQSESRCCSQSCGAATVSHISPKKSHSQYFISDQLIQWSEGKHHWLSGTIAPLLCGSGPLVGQKTFWRH